MWLDLPVDLPIDRPLEVSYSHPGDFDFGDGGVANFTFCARFSVDYLRGEHSHLVSLANREVVFIMDDMRKKS